jgi:hypothetical protein
MLLVLLVLVVVAVALTLPAAGGGLARLRRRFAKRRAFSARAGALDVPDPGRERRAEQRARELLRSCVNAEEWAMYRDLGFIRVWGAQAGSPGSGEERQAAYAYLIYPQKPIVAYVPETRHRRLRAGDSPAPERVLRRVPRAERRAQARPPARLR